MILLDSEKTERDATILTLLASLCSALRVRFMCRHKDPMFDRLPNGTAIWRCRTCGRYIERK